MTKSSLAILCITTLVLGIMSSPFLASAQSHQQTATTDKGKLKVGISTEPRNPKPSDQTNLKIDFLNPQTGAIQEHIDYSISITKGGKPIFGPIPLTHTSLGTVTIPVSFKENGEHQIVVDVQGILFQPIPSEKATLLLKIGEQSSATKQDAKQDSKKADDKSKKVTDKKSDAKKKKSDTKLPKKDKSSKTKSGKTAGY